MFPKKLLFGTSGYPVNINPPSSFTTQTVVDLSDQATYATGTIPSTGWYRAKIGASDGEANTGGYAEQIFYAYNGSKYLIWGCNGTSTGYPWPSGSGGDSSYGILGGGGANSLSGTHRVGQTTVTYVGGRGGGSATGNGQTSSKGNSGSGCGIICGIDEMDPNIVTQTEGFTDHTFSVDTVIAMVLAAGGGGHGDHPYETSPGGGGGGGGAYGDGGRGYSSSSSNQPGTGPGGQDFGKGGNGTNGAVYNAGLGAWAIRDYSTNTFTSGTGPNSRPAAQVCVLEKLIY